MTYIVKYLKPIEGLREELETYPDNIKYYLKYMGFNGSSESIDYLMGKISEYYESKKETE